MSQSFLLNAENTIAPLLRRMDNMKAHTLRQVDARLPGLPRVFMQF